MTKWRVFALLATLFFVAAIIYALCLMSNQRDPLDVLKDELVDPSYAMEFTEEGGSSFYLKLSIIGDAARRGDVDALRALITVSEFAQDGRQRDFLSHWLAEVAASQPELFLAVCSRLEEDAKNTVEMVASGIARYGERDAELEATGPLLQAAREIDSTSERIRKEVKKARSVEPSKEIKKDPGGSD